MGTGLVSKGGTYPRMAAERDTGYRGPYDDGASPLTMGLAGLVLIAILLGAVWMLIPCQWVPGLKPDCESTGPDRDAVHDAVRAACQSDTYEDAAPAPGGFQTDCWCLSRALVPISRTSTEPGLSDEGIDVLHRLLIGREPALGLAEAAGYLGASDQDLYRRLTE